MIEIEEKDIIKAKIEPKIRIIKKELATVLDENTREEGERSHRVLSMLPYKDLLRPFTI